MIGVEENSDAHKENNMSKLDTDSSSLDDDEFIEHERRAINRTNKNMPKPRHGIKVASLNMQGHLKNNQDKLKMVIDWL